MKLLLDTHAFIWWATNRNRLSATALNLCLNRHNEIYLSLISLWEMQIKIQLGKLHFNLPLPQLIAEQQQLNDLRFVPRASAHLRVGTTALSSQRPVRPTADCTSQQRESAVVERGSGFYGLSRANHLVTRQL
jgi:PIN domain nuclease of toxin-antitoxin system